MAEPTREQLAHGYTAALAHIDRLRRERDALKQLNAELLAALKGILAGRPELWGDQVVNGRTVLTIDADAADAADAAIAKAEGR